MTDDFDTDLGSFIQLPSFIIVLRYYVPYSGRVLEAGLPP